MDGRRDVSTTHEAEGRALGVTDPLLTAREVAELLGFAAGTVVDWAEAGRIPHFKIGTALRFRESEVLDWLEEQRRGPELTSTRLGAVR